MTARPNKFKRWRDIRKAMADELDAYTLRVRRLDDLLGGHWIRYEDPLDPDVVAGSPSENPN